MGYINEALNSLNEDKYEFGQDGESPRKNVKVGDIFYFRTNSGWWRKCQVAYLDQKAKGACTVTFKDDRDTFNEYVLTSDLYTREEAIALVNKDLDDADKEWDAGPKLSGNPDDEPRAIDSSGLKFEDYFNIKEEEMNNGTIYTLDSNGKKLLKVEDLVFKGILNTEFPGRIVIYSQNGALAFDDDFDPHAFALHTVHNNEQIPENLLAQSVKQIKVVDHWGDVDWLIQL